jgi:hypothetical protein
MKDFAHTQSKHSSKKSFKKRVKSIIAIIFKTIKKIILGLAALVLILVLGILLLPRFVQLDSNQNLVFLIQNKEGKIDQIYFAYFQADTQLIEVYQLNPELAVNLFSKQASAIKQTNLGDWLQQFDQKEQHNLSARDLTWLSGRVVEKVIWVPADVDVQASSDLSQAFDFNLLNISTWLDFISNQQKLKAFLLTQQAEWEPFKQADTPDFIQTEVLPNDCAIAVINTTGISDYATTLSSVLEQSGARVVRVGNDQQNLQTHRLALNHQKESCHFLAVKLEEKILQGQVELINDAALNEQLLNRYRADMVILLGKPE